MKKGVLDEGEEALRKERHAKDAEAFDVGIIPSKFVDHFGKRRAATQTGKKVLKGETPVVLKVRLLLNEILRARPRHTSN